jgi:hypothetical protein
MGLQIVFPLATFTLPSAEDCLVDQTANTLTASIPPAKVVRQNLSTALLQVQLLRDLLRVAERKE